MPCVLLQARTLCQHAVGNTSSSWWPSWTDSSLTTAALQQRHPRRWAPTWGVYQKQTSSSSSRRMRQQRMHQLRHHGCDDLTNHSTCHSHLKRHLNTGCFFVCAALPANQPTVSRTPQTQHSPIFRREPWDTKEAATAPSPKAQVHNQALPAPATAPHQQQAR